MARRSVLVLLAVLLTAACGVPAPGPGAPAAVDIAGDWTGRVERPEGPLDVGVTLTGPLGDLAGILDLPARGVRAVPLDDVAVDGGTVRFTAPDLPGGATFAGTLAADGSAIGGTFTLDGAQYPLLLRRGAVAS